VYFAANEADKTKYFNFLMHKVVIYIFSIIRLMNTMKMVLMLKISIFSVKSNNVRCIEVFSPTELLLSLAISFKVNTVILMMVHLVLADLNTNADERNSMLGEDK